MSNGKCRSCQADVLWVQSAVSQQLMVLDASPVPNGNVVIEDGKARVLARTLFSEQTPGTERFVDHHSTCPAAKEWRRARRRK